MKKLTFLLEKKIEILYDNIFLWKKKDWTWFWEKMIAYEILNESLLNFHSLCIIKGENTKFKNSLSIEKQRDFVRKNSFCTKEKIW